MRSSAKLGTDTRRLELYVRVSLYFLLLIEPLVVVGAAGPGDQLVMAALSVAHSIANLLVCRWSLTAMRARPITPSRGTRALLAVWGALSLALVVGTAMMTIWSTTLVLPVIVLGTTLGSISAVLSHRLILLAVLASSLGTGLPVGVHAGLGLAASVTVALVAALALTAVVYSFWVSAWMLRVVNELVEARRRAAQLAVAEERLRISRDLHDLFGRTLAAVALKSELASELLRRGRADQAATEIGAVRVLAEETSGEIRQVVRGFRRTDLGSELAGAQSLLDSAGIRCVVHAAGADRLNAETAATLAWMLREAVTNVIRHSRARECFITLAAEDPVRLVVTNDGAPEATEGTGTSGADPLVAAGGLLGMAERLSAVGGEFVRSQQADRFTVEARIPAVRAHAAEVPA